MVLAYAGRRVDPGTHTSTPRFPLAAVPRVAREIDQVLRELRPAIVVGSAACGADLLVLDAAGRLGIRRRIVLPFDRARFRASSVADRPGDWGARFDGIVDAVAAAGDLVELARDPKEPGAYAEANAEILRQADALRDGTAHAPAALVAWNGATRGTDDVTEAFLHEVRRRGWRVREVATATDADQERTP